jgi:CubicO group peptidase (beta-lactamase class C family)
MTMKITTRWVLSVVVFLLIHHQNTFAQTDRSAFLPVSSKTVNEKASSSKSNAALPFSTPEAEGVSSAGIMKFLDAVEKEKNELHSYVIVRHGKIISEGWWSPYGKDLKHIMYSVSKSFTSAGVGLAIAENKLKLTDKIVSFFPESLPDTLSTYMKEMTVENLLMMATGMNTDPMNRARASSNWPKAFLSAPVENKPGSVFKYNNMASFMLSAIVQKLTGQKLFDYLKPRLFEPLGITNVTWDDTPEGYTFGAIGLKLLSEDMAKFGQMLLQKGKWNGKQLLPQSWVEQATSFKIDNYDTSSKMPKALNDFGHGYGYQFWRCKNNAFRADGLGGQFIIVVPDKDAVVVITCSTNTTQEVLDYVWDNLLPAMQDKPLREDKNASAMLAKQISSLSIKAPASNSSDQLLLSKISGKKIELAENETGIKTLSISLKGHDVQLQIERANEKYELVAGKNNWKFSETKLSTLAAGPRANQTLPIKVASNYTCTNDSTIEWTSKFVEESIGSETWLFHFEESGNEIKVQVEIKGNRPRKLEGKIAI